MDFAKIGANVNSSESSTFIKGRTLQLDADFLSYDCANTEESIAENVKHIRNKVKMHMRQAGAEFCNLHLTMGMKGGREQMASVKPYQHKRGADRDPARTERKVALRNEMANFNFRTCKPVVNLYQEADDSLTQYQVADVKNSVLMSGDKDLWMVEGLHCDYKTGRLWSTQGYGKTEYRDTVKSDGTFAPKLIGEGTSWFWYQVVMGDTADTIPGLPKLSGKLAEKYVPNKKPNPKRKAIACGEAKAHAMLKDVKDDRQAYQRVFDAYYQWYGDTAKAMFFEQAFLLWMRKTEDPCDVLKFLKPLGFNYTLTTDQSQRLLRYAEFKAIQEERNE
tara:strand:- start:15798 stop:16799 length:1002 start_codon:yes stop_codon:yes gene_type:complete